MNLYALLADLVLLLHFALVIFVIVGLVLVLLGGLRGWQWVRNGWLRLSHLLAISVVTAQAWLGRACPLTVLEIWLRERAAQPTYEGSFIAHWVGQLLYYSAPPWVFTVSYTAFAIAVIAAWFAIPPRLPWQ